MNPIKLTFVVLLVFIGKALAQFDDPNDISNGSVSGISSLDVGDLNGDGRGDVIAIEGGKHAGGRKTFAWFEAPTTIQGAWVRHNFGNNSHLRSFLGSAKLADMDKDGDLDLIVSSDNHSGSSKQADLYVYINPGSASVTGTWPFHRVTPSTLPLHHINDMEISDMDGDGKLDIIVRSLDPNQIHIFFQDNIASYTKKTIDTNIMQSEGLAVGFLDGDNLPDITFTGHWLKSPIDPRTQNYTKLNIDSDYKNNNQNTKETIGDIDGDGKNDVIISPAEAFRNGGNTVLAWYKNPGNTSSGNWQQHIILNSTNNTHTVKLGDMDNDGDLDVITGTPWSNNVVSIAVRVYYNNGSGSFGAAQVVESGKGLYSGVVYDIEGDGDLDIVGQNIYSRTSKPYIYENLLNSTGPILVTNVNVSPATKTLEVDATQSLTAMVVPNNATNKIVNWGSSDTTVAEVNTSGLVTAKKVGTATITATTVDGGKTATSVITVKEPLVGNSGQGPKIDNISGTVLDGQQIIINGNNFGTNGPNIVLFDDFKRGTAGEDITLQAAIGNWNVRNHLPTYGEDGQNNIAGRFIGDGGGRLIAEFSDVQEIFISYRVMIPVGKHFPNSGAPNTFPPGSQWKLTWLMDGDRGAAGNDDLVVPTWGNGTYFSLAGNDNAFQLATGRATGDTRWFSFLDWNRYSVYMKGGAVPDVDPGTVWSQGMSGEFGQKIFESIDKKLFDGDDTPDGYQFQDDAISRWNRLNVPGWHRGGDDNAAAMYDDIYIATGVNARARIEIGNKPLYSDCNILAITTPTSWQDNTITTTIRQGVFKDGETTYLFVIDTNGNVSDGYPLQQTIDPTQHTNGSIIIYPNPTSDNISIEVPNADQGWTYEIIAVTGQVLQSGIIKTASSNLNLTALSSGTYFVRLTSAAQIETVKVVKR